KRGCAFAPWSRDVISLWPAIDACLVLATSHLPRKRLSVIYAARVGDTGSFIRLRTMEANTDDEAEYDCHGGKGQLMFGSADNSVRLAGIGRAVLVPVRENPRWGEQTGECYETPALRAPDGHLLGWWDDPYGC